MLLLVCAAPLLAILAQAARAFWQGQGAAVLAEAETLAALWNTLRFTAMALLLATGLGLSHALAVRAFDSAGAVQVRRSQGAWALVWRAAAFLPFVVSPVTVAFGLLLLYPGWTASLALLIGAYALLAYPFVAKSLTAALDSLPASYAQAAATLGAGPWRVFWRVTLPLVAPGAAPRHGLCRRHRAGRVCGHAVSLAPRMDHAHHPDLPAPGPPGRANLDAALVLACVLMALALLAFTLIEGRRCSRAPRRPG